MSTSEGVGLQDVSIVIPAKNEEERIALTLKALKYLGVSDVIVVWDGDDKTGEAALKEDAVSFYGEDVGKGFAVRKGLAAASHDAVVILDADLPTTPFYIAHGVKLFKERSADVLFGKRDTCFNLPLSRKVASVVFHWFAELLFGKLPDTQCGFKVVNRDKVLNECWKQNGFVWDLELAVRAKKKGWKVVEYPLFYHYRQSKFKVLKSGIKMLGGMLSVWWNER